MPCSAPILLGQKLVINACSHMNEVTELEGAGSLGKTPFCPFLTIQANISLPTLEGREIFFPQTAFPVHKQKKKSLSCFPGKQERLREGIGAILNPWQHTPDVQSCLQPTAPVHRAVFLVRLLKPEQT